MAGKLEIQWSPNRNKFITWGSEVCLYEIEHLKEQSVPLIKLSPSTGAHLLATNSNYHYVKCIDIYPKSDKDLLLAIGQANGKVVLSTFGATIYDSQFLPGKELIPRHQRPCNAVSWNTVECNKIIAGFEKNRSDYSVLLWDINKTPSHGENGPIRPIVEYGLSDTTHSLAWINGKVLATGNNNKQIRILDFRDSAKQVNHTITKAVHGISVNPHNERFLASYVDHQVCVWDTRNFEKPMLILPHSKHISKITWCTTKQNLLGTLQRDLPSLNLYDIQQTIVGNEEVEPSAIERIVTPGLHNITSFSWHPTDENRFLAISLAGHIVDYTVFDRITLNWTTNANLVWSCGRKTLKYITESSPLYDSLQDISQKIKLRACKGYGLKDELCKNGEMVDDVMLRNVWNRLHLSNKLVEDGTLRGSNSRHPGVRSV
ncbi:WD40 domain-containing protein, partial [Oryctes borbonicus]